MRPSPAAASAEARDASPILLVVTEISGRGVSAATRATISTRSLRSSGSPPVKRTWRTPSSDMAIRASRSILSACISSLVGVDGRFSAGMQ